MFIFSFNPFNDSAAISLCNVKVNSVSVTGNVSLTDEGIDLDDACISFNGTVGICDDDGNEITSISFTAHSDGCDDKPRIVSDDPLHNLQTLEDLQNLGFDNGDKDLESSIPLAYPNPANTHFTLTNLDSGCRIQLIAAKSGEVVKTFKSDKDGADIHIDTNGLQPGTYYIKTVNTDLQTDVTQTIIIN